MGRSKEKNSESFNRRKFYKYCTLTDAFTLSNLKSEIVHYSVPQYFNDPFDCFCGYDYTKYMGEVLIGILIDQDLGDDAFKECLCKIILHEHLDKRELCIFRDYINQHQNFESNFNDFFSDDFDIRTSKIFELLTDIHDEQIYVDFLEKCKDITFQNKMFIAINKVYAITCFCELYDNPLMWSHYADKHRGICIEYDFSLLPQNHYLLTTLFPVKYRQKRPCLPTGVTLDSENKLVIARPKLTRYQIIDNLITKSNIWEGEREWRSINWISNLDDNNNLVLPIISKVYLGANISETDKKNVEKICYQKGISIIQMKLSPYKYELLI